MPRSIITLTTDFGTSDHFVGVMKGVILGLHPDAQVVDITHQIDPYAISEGGFVVAEAYRWFPKKTVHVVVVDPGVGTLRRPILAEAAGQYFLAPDNGVLSMIYAREKHKVRAVTAEKFFLQPVSDTFHGRDVFAPAAAYLAKGTPAARFGKIIGDYCRLEFYKPVRTGKRVWKGTVLKIDRFGNLITNFHIAEFPVVRTRPFSLTAGQQEITELARTFGERSFGELFLVVGSSGYLEAAANQASAAKMTGAAVGAPVELTIY
ncbi:MAG: SAM-dependent chlorinase/fluorinase [Bryobacteraceae bacterium]|jgi:S-adenosylmethionine hydrolase